MKCTGKILIILGCMSGISWQIMAEKMKTDDQEISVEFIPTDKKLLGKIDRNKLELAIVGKHTLAFAKDRLYKDKPDQSELNGWNNTIKEVKKFVEEKTNDKVLIGAMSDLSRASDKLVKTLKLTYSSLFAPGVTGSKAVANDQKNEFLKIEQKAKTVARNLEKESYVVAAKKEVKGLLLYLCPFIETTAAKARGDIDKELKIRGQ